MTQENDTTTERKLWFSGAWGRSLPTSFVQFGPDCIACSYYPEIRFVHAKPISIVKHIGKRLLAMINAVLPSASP